jgi:hypothetical protein
MRRFVLGSVLILLDSQGFVAREEFFSDTNVQYNYRLFYFITIWVFPFNLLQMYKKYIGKLDCS